MLARELLCPFEGIMNVVQQDGRTRERAGKSGVKKLERLVRNPWLSRLRWPATLVLATGGVVLAIQGQQLFLAHPPDEDGGIHHFVAGAVLFALAFAWHAGAQIETDHAPLLRFDRRLAWFLSWAAILNVLSLYMFSHNENSNSAWWLFLASLVVLVFGVALSQRFPAERPARAIRERLRAFRQAIPRRLLSWRALEVTLVVGIVGLGAGLRFFRFKTLPQGIWYDEAQYGLLVRQILSSSAYRPIYAPLANMASPFLFFIAASFKLFGDSIQSIRLVSIVAGIATLPAFYVLARRYMQVPAALASTLLIAVSYWHINFSRIALQGILSPLTVVLTFIFLLRAWRGGKLIDFVLAGFSMSAGIWVYNASNLLPFIVGLFLLFAMVREWRLFRARFPGLLLLAFSALITISPLAMWAVKHQDQYFLRSRQTSIFLVPSGDGYTWAPESQWMSDLKSNIRTHLLMFNYQGDNNGRHNLPGHQELDVVTGVLAVLGLAYVISRVFRPDYFLLLAGFVVGLAAAIITLRFEAPQSLRAIMALPMVFLFAGIALDAGWRFLTAGRWLRLPRASLAIAAICPFLAWAGASNYDVFFNLKANDFSSWASYSTQPTLVAEEIKRLGPDYRVLMASIFVGQPSLEFVDPALGTGDKLSLDIVRDVPFPGDKPTVIFIDPDREAYLPWLRTLYPDATINTFSVPGKTDPVALYEIIVPADEAAAIQGINATYAAANEAPVSVRVPSLDLDWSSQTPLPPPFDADFSGVIQVRDGKMFALTLQAPGQIQLSLDGQVVAQGSDQVTASQFLYKGEHRLGVQVHVDRPGTVVLSDEGGPLPSDVYYVPPDPGHGLLGSYYADDSFSGNVVFQELDPFIGFAYHAELPFAGPLSIIWRGKVETPVAGKYVFTAEVNGQIEVRVDGKVVASNDPASKGQAQALTLTQGMHDIEIRFSSDGGASVKLSWAPPDSMPGLIPSANLYPP